jgi:DNA-directed RNA polymerase specialized sigma24 family protein
VKHEDSKKLNSKIVRLRDEEQLSNSAIAERLGLTAPNVAQRYKRTKEMARKQKAAA